MSKPLVSVLLPSFNYRRYLAAALDSVLNQTFSGYEIIALDDGSTDGSWEMLKEYELRYPEKIRVERHDGHRNLGIVRTYRRAVEFAKGDWIAFLEADDLWEPDNLKRKVAAALNHPECGAVYSAFQAFGEPAGRIYWNFHGWINRLGLREGAVDLFFHLLRRNPISSFSHFIVRRDLLDHVPDLKVMSRFYDWWVLAHIAQLTRFYYLPDKLCRWRIHSQSAAYKRPTFRSILKLYFFLCRLYSSLGSRMLSDAHRHFLTDCIEFGRHVHERCMACVLKTLILNPIETARFAGYFLLRNLLF